MRNLLVISLSFALVVNCAFSQETFVVYPTKPTQMETLAARELRRYIYMCTGMMPQLLMSGNIPKGGNCIFMVGQKYQTIFTNPLFKNNAELISRLNNEEYFIHTYKTGEVQHHIVVGGSDAGVLYGAYSLLKSMGIRYYLEGDVIPDGKFDLASLHVDEYGKPLFDKRGIQPFHDFPEGPDWWSEDDYKAILTQLPKLRMNFFGLHTYPEGGVGPEPTVWIGEEKNFDTNGKVTSSYPTTYNNTFRNAWGYQPKKTGDYHCGANQLFEADTFGAPVQKDMLPWPKTQQEYNQFFNSTSQMLKGAFSYAHSLGVKTCVGTETPLTIPQMIKERLKEQNKQSDDPIVVKELYNGMFERIRISYPVDYYWLWTPESWTWSGASDEEVNRARQDIEIAYAALKKMNFPFRLATCGWVLGPPKDRSEFDNKLPEDIPFSCINRAVGNDPVDPAFLNIKGREKWAIPWLEDDPRLTQPQFWVGRMRKDASDALTYGCNGLLGIHWRTRVLGPNVAALADAAWNQTNFVPLKDKNSTEIEVLGGNTEVNGAVILNRTTDSYLYRSFRGGMDGYNVVLPNGNYKLTLKFAECYYDQADKRVFDISIQGKRVFDNFDIAARVGKNNGLDIETTCEVTDGRLTLRFVSVKDIPNISAIVIEGNNYVRKINCGGEDFEDYKSDLTFARDNRNMASDDFYLDWASQNFGNEAAKTIAGIFTKLDGYFPSPTFWITGPGNIKPNRNDINAELSRFVFVDEMLKIRKTISGAGNIDRFDYWLNTFQYYRELAKIGCHIGKLDHTIETIGKEQNATRRSELITEAITTRDDLMQSYSRLMQYLLQAVTNTSELGTIMNIESLNLTRGKNFFNIHDSLLQANTTQPLVQPHQSYLHNTRIIVPTNRTSLQKGEGLKLKVLILSQEPTSDNYIFWKRMGSQETFQKIALAHISRGVYEVIIPAREIAGADFEYYVSVGTGPQKTVYPATAPGLNRTVVFF
jgi:hypothetical protein